MARVFGINLPDWGGALGRIVRGLLALAGAIDRSDSEDDRIIVRHGARGELLFSLNLPGDLDSFSTDSESGEDESSSGSSGGESSSGGGESSGGGDESSSGGGGVFSVALSHELSASGLKLTVAVTLPNGQTASDSTTIPIAECQENG
jgi:hypothetical protein